MCSSDLNSLNDNEAEIKELRMEVNEVLTREEIMWKQRSRVEWLQNGDRNTKFFHATANQRWSKNRIEGLLKVYGMKKKVQPKLLSWITLRIFSHLTAQPTLMLA